MMLHGCTQTPAEFAATTRFNALADRQGVVVVYPHQTATHNLNRCWNWFEPRHQSRLAGEPAILAGLARSLLDRQPVHRRSDPDLRRRDLRRWRDGDDARRRRSRTSSPRSGVHSGPAVQVGLRRPRRAGRDGRPHASCPVIGEIPARTLGLPPTIVFQGTRDLTVRPAAAAQVTAQWLEVSGAAAGPAIRGGSSAPRTTTSTTGGRDRAR